MKAVIQRVTSASVTVHDSPISSITIGYVVLLGVMTDDTSTDIANIVQKITALRIMNDDAGKMNKSIGDVNGSVLLISQFTLCASTEKGRRPSFIQAMEPVQAKNMYEQVGAGLKSEGIPVLYGSFGSHMEVSLVNDGPVTILLDTKVTS